MNKIFSCFFFLLLSASCSKSSYPNGNTFVEQAIHDINLARTNNGLEKENIIIEEINFDLRQTLLVPVYFHTNVGHYHCVFISQDNLFFCKILENTKPSVSVATPPAPPVKKSPAPKPGETVKEYVRRTGQKPDRETLKLLKL